MSASRYAPCACAGRVGGRGTEQECPRRDDFNQAVNAGPGQRQENVDAQRRVDSVGKDRPEGQDVAGGRSTATCKERILPIRRGDCLDDFVVAFQLADLQAKQQDRQNDADDAVRARAAGRHRTGHQDHRENEAAGEPPGNVAQQQRVQSGLRIPKARSEELCRRPKRKSSKSPSNSTGSDVIVSCPSIKHQVCAFGLGEAQCAFLPSVSRKSSPEPTPRLRALDATT